MNIQFKKGVLELCALTLLAQKNRYGYELVNEISKNILISEGTIYPLLRRLKNDGYVTTYLEESKEGAPRKYYQLTESGKKMQKDLKEEWLTFVKKVSSFLKGGVRNE
jgi:PadR family transcriptional regulator PadR